MNRFQAVVASERAYGLGEGPVWDPARERVLWVDINAGRVHSGTLRNGTVAPGASLDFPETVGAVACAQDGRLVVAGQRDVYEVRPDGSRAHLAALLDAGRDSRLNDGACDPSGRFLVGSLALDGRTGEECLWQLGRDGAIATIDDDLTLSNGLGWSPDGATLYSTDTVPGVVWARPYEPSSGSWGERAAALRIEDRSGSPDGLCVDDDGNLWIAIWGAGEVRCHAPGGECLAVVSVPAPHVSCPAFVGPGQDTLLITTARDELPAEELERCPLSGHLFTARVGATGLRTPWWSPA
jgi:sugar lactone lactonase YvrE